MSKTILHIDASARSAGSTSRALSADLVVQLNGTVIRRDLENGLPFLNATWVEATFTPPEQRTDAHKEALAFSDELVAELQNADVVVIGVPMYNFGVPAVLKAWFDMVARAGVTFQYTENGPVGLLENKSAVLAVASGGVPLGAPVDFATPHLKQFLTFLGISDITIVPTEQTQVFADGSTASLIKKADAIAA